MPIQLDKILENIANEFVLHPNYTASVTKREVDDAWTRVGRNNKLSVHESRSIFKVLQKKYEQEKVKGNSAWKLFGLMQQIHQPSEVKAPVKEEEEALPMDEVEEYEMLEVQEPDDDEEEEENAGANTGNRFPQQPRGNSTGSTSDGDSPTKSAHSSAGGTPEKEEKQTVKPHVATPRPPPSAAIPNEDKKVLLNSLAHANTARQTSQSPASAATAAALQKKGITVKKAINPATAKLPPSGHHNSGVHKQVTQRNTIQLPESLKRKLSEDLPLMPAQAKKIHLTDKTNPKPSLAPPPSVAATNAAAIASAQLIQLKSVKHDRDRDAATYTSPAGINIITVPGANVVGDGEVAGSSAAASNTATANGFATNLQEVNFSSDIIFDAGTVNGANNLVGKGTKSTSTATTVNTNDIINLGNFDNALPPTFFKNLCNSTRHEALGLYVSNIMNRLSARVAAKLEISIVRAILDAQSEELD